MSIPFFIENTNVPISADFVEMVLGAART